MPAAVTFCLPEPSDLESPKTDPAFGAPGV